MKLLVQFGNKGESLFDHRITPIARANNIDKVLVVCRRRGPAIPGVEYYCSSRFFDGFPPLAVLHEFFTLLLLSIFQKPDFITGYLLFPHVTSAFLVAKLTRKPVISSLIGGKYELYSKDSIEKCDLNALPPLYGRILLWLLRHSDIVTTTGSVTKKFLVDHGIRDEKIYAIINPPNENRFHRLEMPKTYDLISVARLIYIKHIEVMLQAIAIAKEKYPDIKACIVGAGPCKKTLMQVAQDLGIKDNLTFIGFQKDVAYYYNSSKIFIHTSEREGMPNAFLEAGRCGLPAVVSACGDIVDIAKDGYNCFVIPEYTDSKAFAGAIIRMLDDEKLRQRMSANALHIVRAISRTSITGTWNEIFSKLAERSDKHKNIE